jgi:DNA-binding NarL/FixJ family response regulator
MKVFIAESSYLIAEGLKAVIKSVPESEFVGSSCSSGELVAQIIHSNPDILFINYASALILDNDVELIMRTFPHIKVIGITDRPDQFHVKRLLKKGISGHLLYSCDADEITEAMRTVMQNEHFFCGKVLEVLNSNNPQKTFTCEGTRLSKRESEVIQWVSRGFSNKKIAEQMFLSVHTVLTHRKNVMCKLGIKNTAGLVVFAVQNGLIEELN